MDPPNAAHSSRSSSPADERLLIESWNPEPLVPENINHQDYHYLLNPRVVTSRPGKYITVDGVKCLNCATHDYLGLCEDPRLDEAAIAAVRKYGVGSCGPRAFYGSMDVHLQLEDQLAKFLNVQETVLYSYTFSTIASAISAYAKATDTVFVDEMCNFAIQQGLVAARSKVVKFKHNDVDDLRQKVAQFNEENVKKGSKQGPTRTFLVVESIYLKTGTLCPLKEILEVKKEHKIRLFIDESRSMGVLGATGRGITQQLDVDISEVDLIMASLETTLCSYGGFCAGSSYIVDHQRLAGTGYCFSGSLPAFQVQTASKSLKIIDENCDLVRKAQSIYKYANEKFERLTNLKNLSHPLSPVKCLVLRKSFSESNYTNFAKEDEIKLEKICSDILNNEQIAISVARYLDDEEMTNSIAAIRLVVSGCLTVTDIDRVFIAIERFSFV